MNTTTKLLIAIGVFVLSFLLLLGGTYLIVPLIIAAIVYGFLSETKDNNDTN
jgi:membrane protein implicated in regulation of membrane protease activity